MKRIEKNYLVSILVAFIALLAAGVFSFIYALINIYQNGTIMNNILELLYMAVHLIVCVMGIMFTIGTIKSNEGSHFMKSLMISPKTKSASKPARIIAISLATLGLLIGIYFTLVLCGVPLPYFHFPIALLLDLVNSPFTMFIIGLFFIFYPNIYHRSLKEDENL